MLRKSLSLVLFAFASISAPAALVINVQEVGADVVVTASGSLDMTGAVISSSHNNFDPRLLMRPTSNRIRQYALGVVESYLLTGGTHDLGAGPNIDTNSITGDTFGISGNSIFYVPGGYSGGPLSGSGTFNGETIAGIGLIPGSYTWTIPSDTITLNIGSVTPVPEPATYIALAGFGGLGLLVWRRRKRVKSATDTLNR